MTEPQTEPTLALDDDLYADGFNEEPLPPPRPRRKLLTPLTRGLAAVILLAAGFIAGVQVQKGQSSGSGSGAAARAGAFPGAGGGVAGAARSGGNTGAGGSNAGGGSAPTVGTVANTRGSTIYVVTNSGTTVRVRPLKGAKVARTTKSSAKAVHPGDTVIVQGTTASNGTVRATSVQATAANAATGIGALFGAGGGGNAPAGAGGTGATGAPQGFGPPPGG